MKVPAYARVSSERQDPDLSISAQLKALRDYVSQNAFIVVKGYIDGAESGHSIDMPGFSPTNVVNLSIKVHIRRRLNAQGKIS